MQEILKMNHKKIPCEVITVFTGKQNFVIMKERD